MKVKNAAPIQEIPQDIDQGFIFYIISNKSFLMAGSQGPLSRGIVPDTEKRKGLVGKDQRISRSIKEPHLVCVGALVSFEPQLCFKLGCHFGAKMQIGRRSAGGRNVLL